VAEGAEAAAAQDDTSDVAWRAIAAEWQSLRAQVDEVDDASAARFAAAEARMRARADERRAADERALKQQLQRLDQLMERATKRATAEDLTLREADRIGRELRNAIEAPPIMPIKDQHAL